MNLKLNKSKRTNDIINAFNRTELREGEKVVDNRDETISNELNLPIGVVRDTLIKYSNLQLEKASRINVTFETIIPKK